MQFLDGSNFRVREYPETSGEKKQSVISHPSKYLDKLRSKDAQLLHTPAGEARVGPLERGFTVAQAPPVQTTSRDG
jgi:hypothetical protein